jgi:hypothetical protein
VRACWADPELDDKMLLADNVGSVLSPIRTGCMGIGMDLNDGSCVPGDQIEHKSTISY